MSNANSKRADELTKGDTVVLADGRTAIVSKVFTRRPTPRITVRFLGGHSAELARTEQVRLA